MQCLSNLTHELLLETRNFFFYLPVREVRMFNLPCVYINIIRFLSHVWLFISFKKNTWSCYRFLQRVSTHKLNVTLRYVRTL